MATMIVKRPVRRPSPDIPTSELALEAPPEVTVPTGRQWTQAMMMLPMVLMMGGMLLVFSGSLRGGLRFVIYGLFGAAMIGMLVVSIMQAGGPNRREMGNARRAYLRQLAQHRVRITRSIGRQRTAMAYLHPEPGALISLAASYRLWERRRDDPDFAVARIGSGEQSAPITLVPPDTKPMEQLEPLSALALRRMVSTYAAVPGLPLAVAVNGFSRIYVRGARDRATALVRAVLAQLATLQAPDDLRIAVCAGDDTRPEWDWTKWLPHALHPVKTDALGPVRLVGGAITAIEAILDDVLANRPRFDPDQQARTSGPQLVVVLDDGSVAGSDHLMTGGGVEGVTVVDLSSPPPRTLDPTSIVLDVGADGRLVSETQDGEAELGTADTVEIGVVEALARQLAPLRLTAGVTGEQPLSADLGLEDLLDIGDPYDFEPSGTWVPRPNRDRLRIPIGIRPDGSSIELDLKESAQEGMGPHGLLIGATGSGKSELLRTLVLGLAVTHPPQSLNFVLVDFKGGATFTRLDALPHTSALITNLADELELVDRMTDAMNGELVRRQELLRAAGNFASLRDYEKARAAGSGLPEVPTLFVVVDEFSELLTAKPDFIDTFVQIGRVGRSLGVHLLLASQRLDEGRLRGLDAHLSYRIGLRTFSEMDSRAVLGSGDAFRLPRPPGHGFIKVGMETPTRFRSAYVSGVHHRLTSGTPIRPVSDGLELMEYTTDYRAPARETDEQQQVADGVDDDAVGESLMDILVDRLAGRGTPAHQVWLPPLDESPAVGELNGALSADPVRGFGAAPGELSATIGIVDRPYEQRRDPLRLDLSAGAGHIAVFGAPRSGRSTALQTIVTALALRHTPAEVQFYCLDFGGGSLGALRGLPHVGSVASRQNEGLVRRTVAEIVGVLDQRERDFAELEVDNIAAYRALRAAGGAGADSYGDVFLVIDGWGTMRSEFEGLIDTVGDIAARGLSYGVHLVITCARSYELRMNMRDLFGTRLELRLGDPLDSMVDRISAAGVPADRPGRGITMTKHQMIVALPRIDAGGNGLQDLVAAVASGWQAAPAPRVRTLPPLLPVSELGPADRPDGAGHRITIGIAENDLGPVQLDFGTEPHFMVFGDAEAGKTNFLRLLAHRIVSSYSPDEARIMLVDHRRGLLGEVPEPYLLGYGTDKPATGRLMQTVAQIAADRMPPADITPERLRRRGWWEGPEVFVLVDDYDMIATSMDNPFQPLFDYLQHGRDAGLHLVLTHRTNGAGRSLFQQFMSRLRDIGTPGLMMSGDRMEGALLGGLRPEALPPGRGRLVRHRGGAQLIQLAWSPPSE